MQGLSVLSFGVILLRDATAQSASGTVPASTAGRDFFGNSLERMKKDPELGENGVSKQKIGAVGANSTPVLEIANASSLAATKQTGRALSRQKSTNDDTGDEREDQQDEPLKSARNAVPQPKEVDTRLPMQCEYSENEILDCFCCLSKQLGAIGRGDLFYAGMLKWKEVEVENRHYDGSTFTKTTNVWQVGGKTPKVVCDQGRLRCVCEDEQNDWAVYESQCTDGQICAPRYGDLESDLMDPKNIDIGLFPYAATSDMTMLSDEIHEGCAVRGLWAAKYKSRLRSCSSQPSHDGSMETRVAMGSGSCTNAPLENCGRFYSRIGCEWRLCEQKELVKQCDAAPRYSKAVFTDDTLRLDQWYRLQRYSPNDAEEMYDVFNLDGNEDIDEQEWMGACKLLDLSPDNHCQQLFRELDRSGEGKLDKAEIVLLFRNSRALWDLTREGVDALLEQANMKEKVFARGHDFKVNKKKQKHKSSSDDSSLVERSANVAHQPEGGNMMRKKDQQVDNGRSNSTKFQKPLPRALPTARRPSKKRNKQ